MSLTSSTVTKASALSTGSLVPATYATFLVGSLALAGMAPFSGFFSKDAVIAAVWDKAEFWEEGPYARLYYVLFASALVTALLTAFYTFRAFFMTFHGETVVPAEAGHHAHESPPNMTIPLAILAVFAAAAAIGFGLSLAGVPLFVGLLLGTIVATTDPAAVVAIFRDLGAPPRLSRLLEGESLLNDAAAIVLFGARKLAAFTTPLSLKTGCVLGAKSEVWVAVNDRSPFVPKSPSAPTAAAARDRGATFSRRPVPWEGSTRIGRWLSFFTAGTTARSRVLREKSENVRTPRSHRITW